MSSEMAGGEPTAATAALPFGLVRVDDGSSPRPLNQLARTALQAPPSDLLEVVDQLRETVATSDGPIGLHAAGTGLVAFASPIAGAPGSVLLALVRCSFDRPLDGPEDLARRFQIAHREAEVVQLVAEGLSNRDVADRLYLSLSTVKTHLRNVYERTGISSREELVTRVRARAARLGAVEDLGGVER